MKKFNLLKDLLDGISAGVLITIGATVYLACENKYVGALLFSVALICICFKSYNLYTGKVGFINQNLNKEGFSTLFLGLLGNAIATIGLGLLISLALPQLKDKAIVLYNAKMEQEWYQTLIRGIFCGTLMYLAVSIFKDGKRIVGIIFCIPVFILSGFEHSIADMAYLAISCQASLKAFGFIWIVILGNSIGGLLLPLLNIKPKTKQKEQTGDNES